MELKWIIQIVSPIIEDLRKKQNYSSFTPAIMGQFGENVSMGQIRTGLKKIGFADMLTIKAVEFNRFVKKKRFYAFFLLQAKLLKL